MTHNLQPDPHQPGEPQFVELEGGQYPQSARDYGLSWVRTAVPVVWGFLLTFLASRFPAVHALVLDNPHVYIVFEGLITIAWYSLWRGVEGKLPAWLTTFLLGANPQPMYALPPATNRNARDEVR